MIKVEHIETFGWEAAVRGMRNPMNSWDRSDSRFGLTFSIGDVDLNLMKKLFNAGTEHRKFLRQIFASMDITAPLYWWKEFDTYKIGTTANSCSTMHKIAAKEFCIDDFSHEHLFVDVREGEIYHDFFDTLQSTICDLNEARKEYLATRDKKYWWQMIQLLPSSYNQRRTVTMNYENVMNMIRQRTGHKLDEWQTFVNILKTLPYVDVIMNDDYI